jgi:hypothetical protein
MFIDREGFDYLDFDNDHRNIIHQLAKDGNDIIMEVN